MLHTKLEREREIDREREREGHWAFCFCKTKWVISAKIARRWWSLCDVVPLLMFLLGVQRSVRQKQPVIEKEQIFPSHSQFLSVGLIWCDNYPMLLFHLFLLLSLQLQSSRISTKKQTFWLDHSSSSIVELLSWDIPTGFWATFLFCLVEIA